MDDFYIGYLQKNFINLDFFISRAQNAIKIGASKLPLASLLQKDHSFQAQEIVFEPSPGSPMHMGGSFTIGKILYRMRMRKTIDEALKWFNQKQTLRQ